MVTVPLRLLVILLLVVAALCAAIVAADRAGERPLEVAAGPAIG